MTNIALPSERPASDARHNTGLGQQRQGFLEDAAL